MSDKKVIKLPSGADLVVTPSPFEAARDLYQALMRAGLKLKLDGRVEIDYNFFKDVLFMGFSDKDIEHYVWECMKKAHYNKLPITKDTFEDVRARQDYIQVLFEVTKENVTPFTSGLYAPLKELMALMASKDQK
jgi:hypothetical protein